MKKRPLGHRSKHNRRTVRVFISPGFQRATSGVYSKHGKPVAKPVFSSDGKLSEPEPKEESVAQDDGWFDVAIPEPEVDSWVDEEEDAQFDEIEDFEDDNSENIVPETETKADESGDDLSSFLLFLGPLEGEKEPEDLNEDNRDDEEVEQSEVLENPQEFSGLQEADSTDLGFASFVSQPDDDIVAEPEPVTPEEEGQEVASEEPEPAPDTANEEVSEELEFNSASDENVTEDGAAESESERVISEPGPPVSEEEAIPVIGRPVIKEAAKQIKDSTPLPSQSTVKWKKH